MATASDPFEKLRGHLNGPPRIPQADFAKQTGIPQSVVSMLVRRERRPSVRYTLVLNNLLGTTLEDWVNARLARDKPRRRRAA